MCFSLSVSMSARLYVSLLVGLPVCLYVSLSVCILVYQHISTSVCQSASLSACLSVCLPVWSSSPWVYPILRPMFREMLWNTFQFCSGFSAFASLYLRVTGNHISRVCTVFAIKTALNLSPALPSCFSNVRTDKETRAHSVCLSTLLPSVTGSQRNASLFLFEARTKWIY